MIRLVLAGLFVFCVPPMVAVVFFSNHPYQYPIAIILYIVCIILALCVPDKQKKYEQSSYVAGPELEPKHKHTLTDSDGNIIGYID